MKSESNPKSFIKTNSVNKLYKELCSDLASIRNICSNQLASGYAQCQSETIMFEKKKKKDIYTISACSPGNVTPLHRLSLTFKAERLH